MKIDTSKARRTLLEVGTRTAVYELLDAIDAAQKPGCSEGVHSCECGALTAIDAKTEPEMMPDIGDMVQRKSHLTDKGVCLTVFRNKAFIDGLCGEWYLDDLHVVSRPPLVPGEGVTHREHPEWGVGGINVDVDKMVYAYFTLGSRYEYELSKLRRDSWHPELHKEEGK